MTRQSKISIRYSISFKQKVVREIEEEGLGISEAARRYGIKGGQTIQKWIKQFGKNHLLNKIIRVEMKGEKDRTKELEQEIKKLKEALADAYLAKDAAEKIIELANKEYNIDLKKNLGQKGSPNLPASIL
ncbi:MAG: transposase [Gloeobacteraceae cyanobacterium ES-bin-316]|nr:transposase [Ferruginibacter sp.]